MSGNGAQQKTTYYALAGPELEFDSFDLGHGVILSKTFVHLMAHPVIAFSPAEWRKPHPGPWEAVKARPHTVSADLFAEMAVPHDPEHPNLHAEWANWIATLMRISTDAIVTLALESPEPFQMLKNAEVHAQLIDSVPIVFEGASIGHEVAQWIKENWHRSFPLSKNDALQFAVNSLYHSHRATEEFGLVSVWAALERLFSAHTAELKYRVCSNIAAFLEPPGQQRYDMFKHLSKLYDDRSNAAHGSPIKSPTAYMDSATIAARVILRIIELNKVPNKDDLEQELLAPSLPHEY